MLPPALTGKARKGTGQDDTAWFRCDAEFAKFADSSSDRGNKIAGSYQSFASRVTHRWMLPEVVTDQRLKQQFLRVS